MEVKFSFNRAAVERRGYTLEEVRQTIKNLFAVHDLPCVSEGNVLAFKDKGHGDDFAVMWDIILALLRPASGRTRMVRRMCSLRRGR